MSHIDTSSSGDESSTPVASPQPAGSKSNFSSRSHAIEPLAPSRGRPATRLATRPPNAQALSRLLRHQARISAYREVDGDKFEAGSIQRHQAVGKPKPRPGFRRYKAQQRFGCSTAVHHGFLFSDTEALNSSRLLALNSSRLLATSSPRLCSATQPPMLRARSPCMAGFHSPTARPFRPRAFSPSKRLAAVASQHNPSAHPSQLRVGSPGKRRATRAAKSSSASSRL